jgi:regulator of protease activity HflC (stomatin/prohibitin superfamily)
MASKEQALPRLPGLVGLVAAIVVALAAWLLLGTATAPGIAAGGVLVLVVLVACSGLTIVQPNQSRVATFLGRYVGTVRRSGFWWVTPLTNRQRVSLRVRFFETEVLKVNDARGNPVEISAVINWQVVDTAKAAFDVDDYGEFVQVQAETAIRHVASVYPYDAYEGELHSLRGNADEVEATLKADLQRRLDVAGVTVLLVGLRRLAYAPEIAADMLRRQQADAVVAARQRIVEGAVGMVDQALASLSEREIVELDEERKAAMVSNLMVVLVSDRGAQPVVNSGSLY